MTGHLFKIEALRTEDITTIAELAADTSENDRQTQMKALGQAEPYDHKQTVLDMVPNLLESPRIVCLKAVEQASNEIAGFCFWGFRGFRPEEMPVVAGRKQPPEQQPQPPSTTGRTDGEKGNGNLVTEPDSDPIKRLASLTDADMAAWVEEVMPAGVRCLYVIMLSVSPKFQGRGIGKALLRWGSDVCDREEVFAWVHSSDSAWKMYEKSGFEVVRSLDIDLDQYAPCPPPDEEPGAKWGHYVFRYMKYLPRRAE